MDLRAWPWQTGRRGTAGQGARADPGSRARG